MNEQDEKKVHVGEKQIRRIAKIWKKSHNNFYNTQEILLANRLGSFVRLHIFKDMIKIWQ